MTPPPYFFRIFDLKKYREIEPVIFDILNSSINADRIKVLLQEAIDIVEGDELKKYNDKSMRYDFGVFQSMMSLIAENRFEEWREGKDDEMDDYYPENIAIHFIEVLCCPKYQLWHHDNSPQSENTLEYQYHTDSFYSFGDVHSILEETGVEELPFKRGFSFLNPRQIIKFIKIISDDYELLRDPENILYAIIKKSPDGHDYSVGYKILSMSPTSKELGEEYYGLPRPAQQSKMIDFYERIIDLLRLTNSNFTIANDFWFNN